MAGLKSLDPEIVFELSIDCRLVKVVFCTFFNARPIVNQILCNILQQYASFFLKNIYRVHILIVAQMFLELTYFVKRASEFKKHIHVLGCILSCL